jgi:putative transposase
MFEPGATCMITAAAYKRQRLFNSDEALKLVSESLFYYAEKYSWKIKAYVIVPNHYHILVVASSPGHNLTKIIQNLNSYTANEINEMDSLSGRRVWLNYWDTCITHKTSYYARINYIHYNPTKHGYVDDPLKWEFSSLRYFHEYNSKEAVRIEKEYPFARVNVMDDF